MDKPQKPTNLLPRSFGGQKEAFDADKIANGYQPDVPDILGGANLNYTLDSIGKELDYTEKIADFVNGLPPDNVISVDKNNKLIYKSINEFGSFGLPPGTLIPTFCNSTFIPNNCLPCNGSQYTQAQFMEFYNNYLIGNRLLTCTYEEYASSISTYGKCGKFAVDATVGTFKTPYLPDGSFIQQAMTDTELGKAYKAGLPAMTLSQAGAHTHTRGTMEITGAFNSGRTDESGQISGAFYRDSATQGFTGGGSNSGYKLNFAASRAWSGETSSNGAHTHTLSGAGLGNSTTVQPESVALRWFVVVGTGAINEADMDWSAWATGLNGRANTDLSNLSTTGQAVLSNKADINALNFSASGKDYLSKIGMPSNRHIGLTIGATGAEYTAPANGYFAADGGIATSSIVWQGLTNVTASINSTSFNTIGYLVSIYMPVKKGDIVKYDYRFDTAATTHNLRFVYAEGAE